MRIRIISGKFGGQWISADVGKATHPMGDRVRGAVFAMLESRGVLVGARVLDAFAGTGALGFETLSRGARSVDFFEKDKTAQKVIEQNIEILGVNSPENLEPLNVNAPESFAKNKILAPDFSNSRDKNRSNFAPDPRFQNSRSDFGQYSSDFAPGFRGKKSAASREKVPDANITTQNLAPRAKLYKTAVENLAKAAPDTYYDIIFADPPYQNRQFSTVPALPELLGALQPKALLVLSYPARGTLLANLIPNGVVVVDNRIYGEAAIALLRLDS